MTAWGVGQCSRCGRDERSCNPANPSRRYRSTTCEPSAGRRLRLQRRPPASARSRPAVQSALDCAASAGHSYAYSSGSPLAALEADAKLAAEQERRIEAEKQRQRNAEGRKKPGKPAAPLPDEPDPKAQRNFTDPDSRIMKSKEGFVQAYNAPSTQRPRSLSRTNSRSAAAIRANWCPWSRPSRTISAASQSRPQRTLATAAKPISKRS